MKKIEQRSLGTAKWINLFMAVAGIVAAIGSNASALMLDGVFSGINVLAAILAAKVADSISKKPSSLRPFGYEIDEAMYVMFRSLVLTGVIIMAGLSALSKIIDYINGSTIEAVKLDWIIVYMAVMVCCCAMLALYHHKNWLKTNRQSELLETERSSAIIDGVLSAAAAAAFVLISFLKGTQLDFLVPISDSIVVICLVLYMIPTPIRAFRKAIKQVVGESADPHSIAKLKEVIDALLSERFTLLEVSMVKVGRSYFSAIYLRPEHEVLVTELDELRGTIERVVKTHYSPHRFEVIFTANPPYQNKCLN